MFWVCEDRDDFATDDLAHLGKLFFRLFMENVGLHVAIKINVHWELVGHLGNRVLTEEPLPVQKGHAHTSV